MRPATEARHSLTKFMVIICIAVSLEALLRIVRVHDDAELSGLVYLQRCSSRRCGDVGLGAHQKLSMSIERKDSDDGERAHRR